MNDMVLTQATVQVVLVRLLVTAAFLLFATVFIGYASEAIREIFSHKYKERTILDLVETLASGAMWFSAILLSLSLLGFPEIAASMGTAAGFVALGVSLALRDMISDTVAGVYLAKDPDFHVGDHVEVDGKEGKITDVGLRKSRLEVSEGETFVLNNTTVEKKWTKYDK